MKVYLAGPINGCTDDQAGAWREQVKAAIGAENCIDPMRRDYRGREEGHEAEIVSEDLADIENADVMLANCWQPSWGTAMEVFYACENIGVPVIAVVPPGAPVSPWLAYHATVVRSLSEALAEARACMNRTAVTA